MNIPQTDTTIEHRCEALTISEIPPYCCTTSAPGKAGRSAPATPDRSTSIGSTMMRGGRTPVPWLTSRHRAARPPGVKILSRILGD
jgi:hypothetical protein